MKILEQYAESLVRSSAPYGYTAPLAYFPTDPTNKKLTRGWLYEEVVREWFGLTYLRRGGGKDAEGHFDEFLIDDILDTKVWYLIDVVKELALDLDAFYVKVVMKYLEPDTHISNARKLDYLKNRFNYRGKFDIGEVLDFLKSKLAREHIPKLPLRVFSMKRPEL